MAAKSYTVAIAGATGVVGGTVRRILEVPVDYRGFEVGDHFVVGYGLDFAGRYRTLPAICVLKDELFAR